MKRIQIYLAAVVVAVVPAVVGLWGNASFSGAVPVRVPAPVQTHASTPGATPIPPAAYGDDGPSRDRGHDNSGPGSGGHGSDD